MIDLILNICNFLRPILFIVLLGYVPLKIGIGFDFAFKAPTPNEIRASRNDFVEKLFRGGVLAILFVPFRFLAIIYFTAWLLVDKNPWLVTALFLLTLLPVYFA